MENPSPEQIKHDFVQSLVNVRGLESALQYALSINLLTPEEAAVFEQNFKKGVENVGEGGPVLKRTQEGWYPGAQENDPTWRHFCNKMAAEGKMSQLESVAKTSDFIVGLTPDVSVPPPTMRTQQVKGLVVGHIQSGKTTNFTAVIAKLADLDYRMVIVLAGVHNSLRSQTQKRLSDSLIPKDQGRWFELTGAEDDFDLIKIHEKEEKSKFNVVSYLRSPGKTVLVVVKKNAIVLQKLLQWLKAGEAPEALRTNRILVIDDEADQASVDTATINPLIRNLLALMPLSTYIGYTATPFANVFIDPSDYEDLYPRDFIYPLPRPEGYFGPEMLFGRDASELENSGGRVDGYDMVRLIPEEDEFLYRPKNSSEYDFFSPVMTEELKNAVAWYLLATSARFSRLGDVDFNSSMLIHTSFQRVVHDSYRPVVEKEIGRIKASLELSDTHEIERLKSLWFSETSRVDATEWGRNVESFEEVLSSLPAVLEKVEVIVDNSSSERRLVYGDNQSNFIIAIGGNTLSRGITLEGLVSSLFLRPSNTYDTLLQMGRWFGFRTGYEELPRLWTTATLYRAFRHLALVEREMRVDMESYSLQDLTPMDAAVRIRSHPALRVTAKMGAAEPARISYSGARVQIRYYRREHTPVDTQWLIDNWQAGERLIREATKKGRPFELDKNGSVLFKNVDAKHILSFLSDYNILPEQGDLTAEMVTRYIRERISAEMPQMAEWNVIVRSGESNRMVQVGDIQIRAVNRAPLQVKDEPPSPIADLGTLMVPQDLIMDIPGVSSTVAREMKESGMKNYRFNHPDVKDKGLLVLYPIDRDSSPQNSRSSGTRGDLNAPFDILGLGLVFPRTRLNPGDTDSVRSSHYSVDVSAFPEDRTTTEDDS